MDQLGKNDFKISTMIPSKTNPTIYFNSNKSLLSGASSIYKSFFVTKLASLCASRKASAIALACSSGMPEAFMKGIINRDLRIERNAQGELLLMPPTGGETSERNAEITMQLRLWAICPGLALHRLEEVGVGFGHLEALE